MGQKFMSGVTGDEIPQVTNIPDVPPPDPDKGFFSQAGEKFMQTFDPRRRGTNPEFAKLKALGDLTGNPISDEAIIGLGIPKESSFTYQYGPALYTGLSSLPIIEQYLGPQQEEVDPDISQNLYKLFCILLINSSIFTGHWLKTASQPFILLSESIITFLKLGSDKKQMMGENARLYFETEFEREKQLDKIINLFNEKYYEK